MKEDQLQHQIVMRFSAEYVDCDPLLFHVPNKPSNYLKSIGQKNGVADLILQCPWNGRLCGIELKAPGSYHSKKQIKKEITWGNCCIENGGLYLISSDEELINYWIDLIMKCHFEEVERIQFAQLENVEIAMGDDLKTIRF